VGMTMEGDVPGSANGSGAAGGDRTHDPWLRRPILYPLSYSRVEGSPQHTAFGDYRLGKPAATL
jgi:hypothetical protein